jgi:1,6-anhydro-N-acetylmuramate kinase
MGYAFLKRIPANVPSVTGAKHALILGKLTPNPFRQA